jgi:hypothetical protein
MRAIIAGSRGFDDYDMLSRCCDREIIGDNIEVVVGGARGADTLGEKYAISKGYNLKKFVPNWNVYGKSAGYLRNEEMAKYASLSDNGILIIFWDGTSRGSSHMISLANKYKLKVRVIRYLDNQDILG